MRALFTAGLTSLSLLLGACVTVAQDNPAFPTTRAEAKADIERMRDDPKPIERPIVVLAGYRAWYTFAPRASKRIRKALSIESDQILTISYPFAGKIEDATDKVIRMIEERWPSDDPEWTVEVDVVGISMGGIVAREAALESPIRGGERKRLRIGRLFTLATPHRGAKIAQFVRLDPAARDLSPGSAYLEELNSRPHDYEIVPYSQLRDNWVGATRAAPPDMTTIWTSGTWLFSHFSIATNPVMIADIARRIRGEEPLSSEGEPPPRD